MTTRRKKEKGPGQLFEDSFRDSIPHGVYIRRLRSPVGSAFAIPQLVGIISSLCAALGRPVPEAATNAAKFRFTPKAGFDLLLTAPAAVGPVVFTASTAPFKNSAAAFNIQPSLFFALELKSVDGASLPFANVDGDQEKALAEAAAAGHVACLVIEFRKTGEVWAVPIQVWREVRLRAERASLPVADARRLGIEILPDPHRGTSRQYWNVGAFLVACGALLPEKAAKASRSAAKVQESAKSAGGAGGEIPGLFDRD